MLQNKQETQSFPVHAVNQQAAKPYAGGSALLSKNVRIHSRRTSVRLEPEMWNALKEIAAAERRTIHDVCSAVHDLKEPGMSFTAALRVFLMEYYRSAAKSGPQIHFIRQHLHSQPAAVASSAPAHAMLQAAVRD